MPPESTHNIISLAQARAGRFKKQNESSMESCFYYTMDLLMEDFGKKHDRDFCMLCEPMKVLGLHRDEAIVKLNVALFTTFFPDFEEYLLEIKENMVQGLLRRNKGPTFPSWQEKLRNLLQGQIKKDAESFLDDIVKHLTKFNEVELDPERREALMDQTFERLQTDWIPDKFTH